MFGKAVIWWPGLVIVVVMVPDLEPFLLSAYVPKIKILHLSLAWR